MKITLLIIAFAIVSCNTFATTYYVATNGSNSNNGTSTGTPFLTIQKSLDVVIAGDVVNIMAGTYPEALVLKTTGSSSAMITIRNYNGASVTVSSDNSKALRAGGRRHYYVFDGLRFISNHMVYDAPYDNDFTLDFKDVIWDGNTADAGNCGFIVRNCYIEGAVRFYGHSILVENCELNGKSLWRNGIMDGYTSSHDNIYRKNTIYGYIERGVWSMQYTDNILIEENIIHDIYNPLNGNNIQAGVDCDGAGHPVTRCIVRKNIIYNVGGRLIEMENSFNSIVEDNIGHDSKLMGIHFINYGLGSADFTSDAEHRTTSTNSIVRNNVIYNTTQDGIIIRAAPGTKVYNNTIYSVSGTKGYYGGISLIAYGGYYCHNVDIRNNIVMQGKPWAIYIDQPAGGLIGVTMTNNVYYDSDNANTHHVVNKGNNTSANYTLSAYQTLTGRETLSKSASAVFVNSTDKNFHLTNTSACIDDGSTLADVPDDIEGITRPQGAAYDVGAYEYQPETGIENSLKKDQNPDFIISPNPFNPTTSISFTLSEAAQVKISIFNLNGGCVRNLVNEKLNSGMHTATWDAKASNGQTVSSGSYVARMETGKTVRNKKICFAK